MTVRAYRAPGCDVYYGTVTVRLPGNWEQCDLRVTDLLGRTVASQHLTAGTGQALLGLEGWAPGVYVVTAVLDGKPTALKLVVE